MSTGDSADPLQRRAEVLAHAASRLASLNGLCENLRLDHQDLDDESFSEKMLQEFASYACWVTFEEDCERFGCRREQRRFFLKLEDGEEEVTELIERCFKHVRRVATESVKAWRSCAERVMKAQPGGRASRRALEMK